MLIGTLHTVPNTMPPTTAEHRLQALCHQLQPYPTSAHPSSSPLRDDDVLILAAARTPIGNFQGALASLTAPQLGAEAIKAALQKSGVDPRRVEECLMGIVLSSGVGQGPARQAALAAGLPVNVCCTTVNKLCASGMKSIALGCNEIKLGHRDIVVAGGMESMTNAPYLLNRGALGRMGDQQVVDSMMFDGLTDPWVLEKMGVAAELASQKYKITRQQQDDYARQSFERAQRAMKADLFRDELAPLTIKQRGGKSLTVTADERPHSLKLERMSSLPTAFPTSPKKRTNFAAALPEDQHDSHNPYPAQSATSKPTATVTPANASSISDGAAAAVLCSSKRATELGLLQGRKSVFRILATADAETAPLSFTVSPSLAIPLALKRAKLSLEDVQAFEINEAFAVVAILNRQLLNIPAEKLNPVWRRRLTGSPHRLQWCTHCRHANERFGAPAAEVWRGSHMQRWRWWLGHRH